MKYIIDVLRGSKEKRILSNRHDQLSTYGIGKDHSLDEWRSLGRSLLHQGLVEETSDGYGVLKLNALSWEVMRKQRSVMIALPNQPTSKPEATSQAKANAELLFDQLRSLRKRLADEHAVPPYVIFADSSLRLMAQVQPQTSDEFAEISGVGSHKLKQYGDRFVREIRAFCEQQGIPLRDQSLHQLDSGEAIDPQPLPKPLLTNTHLYTLELYQDGLTPSEIAATREVRLTTIYDHLSLLMETGQPVNLDDLVPPPRQSPIQAAIETVGADSLRAIRDHLGDSFDYQEIRLVRSGWRRSQALQKLQASQKSPEY